MVANSQGYLYYKAMTMTMEGIGEEMDELWWWISFDELQMDMLDGGSVWR
jgi:hypothetical protein